MRIVYFSRDYSPHDHRFLSALADSEHDVHYLRLEKAEPVIEQRPVPAGISVIDWWGGRRELRATDWPRAIIETRQILGRLSPDLVHAGPVQSPAFLAAAAGFHPLLTMSWGSDLMWDARAGWGRLLARWTLRHSDAFTCDCDAVRRQAVHLGLDEDRIFVFPWGVDLDRFHPGPATERRETAGFGSDDLVVLSTRPWERFFGISELVDGFVQAAQVRPELRLWMIGRGSLRPYIEERLGLAGLMDRARLDGPMSNAEMPTIYQSADIYLSASHSDGSSISLLEAMACGMPALVSDIRGNREWVLPGENGWWFPTGDAASIGRALERAAERRAQFGRMGQRARAIAEQRADWNRNFEVLLRAYEFTVQEAV
ncbi:MAG: glycosyltransferase family 4 protein [Anaerolineales bacterium]